MESAKIHNKGMGELFDSYTKKNIERNKKALKEHPDGKIDNHKIADYMPFLEWVNPRTAKRQNLRGLTILSFYGKIPSEAAIVRYGLEPLLEACIINENEATAIGKWFDNTEPQPDNFGFPGFTKSMVIEGHTYTLETHGWSGYRDLIILCC